jgi:hypothetical protein
MNKKLAALLLTLALTSSLHAQDELRHLESKDKDADSGMAISHEIHLETSYVGSSKTKQGEATKDPIESEVNTSFGYVVAPQVDEMFIPRIGVNFDRYSYGRSEALSVPNQLQSASAVIGLDTKLNEDWLIRFEAQPGVYSDFEGVSLKDVNVPFIIGASYLVNEDLQWFFGASVDLWRDYPVLPGAGVRWRFADDWTLNLQFPQPRLVYSPDKQWELFVGADMKGGSYRVNSDLGANTGHPEIRNAVVSMTEVRGGAGANWKPIPNITVGVEAGYMFYRTLDYHRADLTIKSDPAPYTQLSVSAGF